MLAWAGIVHSPGLEPVTRRRLSCLEGRQKTRVASVHQPGA
jgi:hypothetical protein